MSRRRAITILFLALAAFTGYSAFMMNQTLSLHRKHICLRQQEMMEGAKEQYGLDHAGEAPPGFEALIPDYLPEKPRCPSGGIYTLGDLQIPVSCSVAIHRIEPGP